MGLAMVHPDLPGQPITVIDPRAVEIYERGGWQLADETQRPAVQFEPGPGPAEGEVAIYHPVSEATAYVPAEAVPTYRMSGWLTVAEQQANEASEKEAAATAAAAEKDKAKAARAASSKEE